MWKSTCLAAVVLVATACRTDREPSTADRGELVPRAEVERALDAALAGLEARADSIDEALQPIRLLTPGEESALRRYLQSTQLVAARRFGVPRPRSDDEIEQLLRDGRLVELAASTPRWVVRDLDYSVPLVTPDVPALLSEIGERFQAELAELELPPYRLEVTSVLRTAADQAALQRANPNAAGGVSTHEYGTTVDVAYSAFAAPLEPIAPLQTGELEWLAPRLDRIAAGVAEAAAARKSRELQAILGRVLLEMQREGKVYVTLERAQPVYHMTVARRLRQES